MAKRQNSKPNSTGGSGKGQNRRTVPPAGRARQGGVARGGVPPLDAFDGLQPMPPPDLPGVHYEDVYDRPPEQHHVNTGEKTQKVQKGTKKNDQGQRERASQKVTPQKTRRRRKTINVLVFFVFVLVCLGFLVSMMLKIQKFEVVGECPYTQEELVEAFGGEVGDNLIFSFNAGREEESMQRQLPYLEEVRISRRPLNTIVFHVTAATERYYAPWDDGYIVLSDQCKVLAVQDSAPEGLILMTGLGEEATVKTGDPLVLGSEEAQEAMNVLLEALAAHDLAQGMTAVDVSDPIRMSFVWQGRITVQVGSKSNIQAKLDYAYILLTDTEQSGLTEADRGILDVSGYPTSPNAVFSPA